MGIHGWNYANTKNDIYLLNAAWSTGTTNCYTVLGCPGPIDNGVIKKKCLGALTWAHTTCELYKHFLIGAITLPGLAFVVLIFEGRAHLSNNHQRILKQQSLLLTSPRGYTRRLRATQWGSSEREREREKPREWERERERQRERETDVVFSRFTLIGEFKTEEWEVSHGKGKQGYSVSYLGQSGLSKRGNSWVGSPGSLSGCVAAKVFIWDACLWNGCLDNQKLNAKHLQYNIYCFKKSELSGIYPTHLLKRLPNFRDGKAVQKMHFATEEVKHWACI